VGKGRRLIWQLYPSYLLITILSLITITWYASKSLRDLYLESTTSDLESRAMIIGRQVFPFLHPLNVSKIDQLCKSLGGLISTRITVTDASGRVLGDSMEDPEEMDNHLDRPEVIGASKNEVGVSIRYSLTLETNMLYVAVPIKDGEATVGVVRTSLPLTMITQVIHSVQVKIFLGGLIIACIAALVSFMVSRRISRPIEEIKRGAERFARGDFSRSLPDFDAYEIGSLSETMNDMARALNDLIRAVTRQTREVEAILSSMVEAVVAVDKEERVIRMNQAASHIFNCDQEGVKGRGIHEVSRNTGFLDFVKRALASWDPVEKDLSLFSDSERILHCYGTVLHDEKNERTGALIVLDDVTRLRKLENMRRNFAANVSHELKTPITAIKGFVETLEDGAVNSSDNARRFLSIISKHANRLEAIIDDLMNLSRIEDKAEGETISLAPGRIKDILEAAVGLCEIKAKNKGMKIILDCPDDLTADMSADLLQQAIVNLLDNAIQYSPEGKAIAVEAIQAADESVIHVRDQGRGIERKHLSRIFERFYRADKARSRNMGGTGLGLSIVKHIVQVHHGHVTVESAPGKGSTFSVHLPLPGHNKSPLVEPSDSL
jgi:two-component system phosphate regulon sensor histidine kinase PhoR